MLRPGRSSRGFALVVTLSLMILLTVIAIGLLSLSSITLRASSTGQMMQEARQNARLALILAIGELQSTTGPDQRVSAPAQVRGKDVKQPHLTGVWQGWKWDGTGTANYEEKKKSQFLRWLVSSRDSATASDLAFVDKDPAGAVETLVRGDPDKDKVDAQIVTIISATKNSRQGFAWAVFDESTKLPTALPEPGAKSVTASTNRMSAAPLPGYASTTQRNWDPLGLLAGNRSKLITAGQTGLAGVAAADRSFHDLTSRSAGILADVGKGGLSVDLSRLFSNATDLPGDYKNRFLYSGTDTPLVPPPARFNGANPFPSPDPSWSLLHSHYRLYDKLTGGLTPTLATSNNPRPAAGTVVVPGQNDAFFKTQQIVPVLAKAQFVFSLSFGYNKFVNTTSDTAPLATRDPYSTYLVIDPVITLWNPYNVSLRYTGGRIDLYRVPLSFRLYKNGTLINAEYTHMANTYLQGADFNNRANAYYRLNLLPPKNTSELIMAPGEHIVLTSTSFGKHLDDEYIMDLRPGFSPPAGSASLATVGGISTVNVCVGNSGLGTGTFTNPNQTAPKSRTVTVKVGDVIQVEVMASQANIDTPPETGGKEVSGFLKYYVGAGNNPSRVGGIELDYGNQVSTLLPNIPPDELTAVKVHKDIPKNVQADNANATPPVVTQFKEPFLITTFQLKTERDSKFPARGWIHNSPVNLFASGGIDQKETWTAHQYELQWAPMTYWGDAMPISNTNNRGFGGPGISATTGLEFATHSAIPVAPALSLAQLRHAPLNTGGQLPLISQIVANSFVPPLLDPSSVRKQVESRTLLDHSFYANSALFDRYFFSGLAEPGGPLDQKVAVTNAITALFDNATPLPNNPRFVPHRGSRSTAEIAAAVTAPDGHLKTAAHLLIDSPFNVNSTRVDVWEAVLGSTFASDVPQIQGGQLITATSDDASVARHLPSNGSSYETATTPISKDLAKWNGNRRLTPVQIRKLAEEIVVEIQKRGPFQSVAEFVNRRPEGGPPGQPGVLQAALDRAEINKPTLDAQNNLSPGNSADGAPGIINQADLLTPIAPLLTARGDTFRIRAYGEAGPQNGPKVGAWCEAVVQRVPEYLDPTDESWVSPAKPTNARFGRRYEMIGFRWLSSSEI